MYRKIATFSLAALLSLHLVPVTVAAEEPGSDPFEAISLHNPQGSHAAQGGGGHSFHNHHLGIFNGYARKDDKKVKDGYKIGLEYEYQFSEWFGVRGFLDYEFGDLKKWIYGAGLGIHVPDTGLVLFVGGGVEVKGSHSEAILRLSAEYQFYVSEKIYLAPTAGYDFVNDREGAWFAGVMLGTSF